MAIDGAHWGPFASTFARLGRGVGVWVVAILVAAACSSTEREREFVEVVPDAGADEVSDVGGDGGPDGMDAEESADDASSAEDASDEPEVFAPPFDDSLPLGGARPAELVLPSNYDRGAQWPLVVMLHGYGSWAGFHRTYFGFDEAAERHGFIGVAPNGTVDIMQNRFFSATEACCDHYGTGVDDVAYLTELLDEIEERLAVDSERIYFLGHSNGGFMSLQMACELGSRVRAVASLAGSSHLNADDCRAPGETSILQIHGTADTVIPYSGGFLGLNAFPGVETVSARWVERLECEEGPDALEELSLVYEIPGDETERQRWSGCREGRVVELWQMNLVPHLPTLRPEFMDQVVEFFESH